MSTANNRIVIEALDGGFLITVEIYAEPEDENPAVKQIVAATMHAAMSTLTKQLARIRP